MDQCASSKDWQCWKFIISQKLPDMRWTKIEQGGDVPLARSSHVITGSEDSEHLVLFGGEWAPRQPVKADTCIFDIVTSSWTSIGPTTTTPSERLGSAGATIGTTVYLHGGRSEVATDSALDDIFAFDTLTGTWRRLEPSGPRPQARNYHSAAATNGKFYIFGGCGKEARLADLWAYDPREPCWTSLPTSDAIKGRGGAGFLSSAGSLWVLGGFTGEENGEVHRFDLRTNAWEHVQTKFKGPQARFTPRSVFGRATHETCGASCVSGHGGHIICFGGEIDPSDQGHAGAGAFCNQLLCLDPESDKREWHALEVAGEWPSPRGWIASCAVSNGMIVSGGIDENNTRLGDLYLLDVHAH